MEGVVQARRGIAFTPEQFFGRRAGNRARTDDLLITNQLLYQLSYAGNDARSVAQS